MGKSKKRILYKGINDTLTNMSRESALEKVVLACKNKKNSSEIFNIISLFGLTAEELLEAGALYEDVLALNLI